MARPAIVVALPSEEQAPVAAELQAAGFETLTIARPDELEAILASRRDVAVAILDGESDFDTSLELYAMLREGGRTIPALMVVSPRSLDRLAASSTSTSRSWFTPKFNAAEVNSVGVDAPPKNPSRS